MFDVTDRQTFKDLQSWYKEVERYHRFDESSDISKLVAVVGNKSDSYEREVKREEAESVCETLGVRYFETSAKNVNLEEVITYLLQNMIETKEKKQGIVVAPVKAEAVPKKQGLFSKLFVRGRDFQKEEK